MIKKLNMLVNIKENKNQFLKQESKKDKKLIAVLKEENKKLKEQNECITATNKNLINTLNQLLIMTRIMSNNNNSLSNNSPANIHRDIPPPYAYLEGSHHREGYLPNSQNQLQ